MKSRLIKGEKDMNTYNDVIYYSIMLKQTFIDEKGREHSSHKEISLRHRAEEAAQKELIEVRKAEPEAYLMEWRTRGSLGSQNKQTLINTIH